jgi:hypothetical protein
VGDIIKIKNKKNKKNKQYRKKIIKILIVERDK